MQTISQLHLLSLYYCTIHIHLMKDDLKDHEKVVDKLMSKNMNLLLIVFMLVKIKRLLNYNFENLSINDDNSVMPNKFILEFLNVSSG